MPRSVIRGGKTGRRLAMLLEEMTTVEVEEALKSCQSVIIPFGVMEAHGPHLPLCVDTLQAYDAAKRAAALTPVFVAAPVPYGYCRSLAGHPGTIGITAATLRSLAFDIMQSLYATGVRNFILYSGHASAMHNTSLEEAAERLISVGPEANVAVVVEYDVVLKRAAGLYETARDQHAGEVETSRVLTIRPDLVRTDRLPEESYRDSARPILVRDVRRYWPTSVEGAPRLAAVEKGEKIGRVLGQYLAELVKRMEQFKPH
jgi:creatinine amidohydrolase